MPPLFFTRPSLALLWITPASREARATSWLRLHSVLQSLPMSLRLLLLAVVAMFLPACTRSLPKYEKPIARTQFQRVRTTAYTHTESDHRCHGCQTAIGTTLRYDTVHSAAADW